MMKKRGYPERPRDVNQLAKRIVDISTGQVDDKVPEVDAKAQKRGEARAKALSPRKRTAIAKKAAAKRWAKKR